jgi:hypothetical protein
MADDTEDIRRLMVAQINARPGSREALEAKYGKVWDTDELCAEFDVIGFLAPMVVAVNRTSGKRGSLTFQHDPRFYFDWREHVK